MLCHLSRPGQSFTKITLKKHIYYIKITVAIENEIQFCDKYFSFHISYIKTTTWIYTANTSSHCGQVFSSAGKEASVIVLF